MLKFIDAKIAGFAADDFNFGTASNVTPPRSLPSWKESGAPKTSIRVARRADNLKGTDKNDLIDGGVWP